MSEAYATITTREEKHQSGRLTECLYAQCEESGDEAGPVWGSGPASIRRVLATLTERCSCGASFHVDEDDADDEEDAE